MAQMLLYVLVLVHILYEVYRVSCKMLYRTTANYFIPIQAHVIMLSHHTIFGGHRGRDRRVVRSKTTCAASAYRN
jgi:hypothetical protein